VKAYEMAFIESLRKKVGWRPMKNSLRNEKQENCFSSFKLENDSQIAPRSAGLQEGKVLKAQVSLSRDGGIAKIVFPALIVFIISAIYISGNSVLDILPFLIMYLAFLALILYNRNTVTLNPEKVIIHRHLFKPLVLRKDDILQISVSKNKNHTYRWPTRLLTLTFLAIQLHRIVEGIIRGLQIRETSPVSAKLTLFLGEFLVVAFLLTLYYIFELLTPYKQTLKVTTHSNLNLEFYIEEPEELIAVLRNEKKEKGK
jgi:hypothetical protein